MVTEDEAIQPDGKTGQYATIEFQEGSAVSLVDEKQNVYLTEQFRCALERNDLEAAGGMDDETPLEAAKRETREKLDIEAEDWTCMDKIEENTSVTHCTVHLFLVQKLAFKKTAAPRHGKNQSHKDAVSRGR